MIEVETPDGIFEFPDETDETTIKSALRNHYRPSWEAPESNRTAISGEEIRRVPQMATTVGGPKLTLPDADAARTVFGGEVAGAFGEVAAHPGVELPRLAPTMEQFRRFTRDPFTSEEEVPTEVILATPPTTPEKLAVGSAEGLDELTRGVANFFTSGPGVIQLGAAATPLAPAVYAKWALDMANAGFTSAEEAWDAFQKSDWKNVSKNTVLAFGSFLGAFTAAKHGYKELTPVIDAVPRGDLRDVRVEDAQRKALEATMPPPLAQRPLAERLTPEAVESGLREAAPEAALTADIRGMAESKPAAEAPLNPGGALKDLPQELQDKSNAVKDAMRAEFEALKENEAVEKPKKPYDPYAAAEEANKLAEPKTRNKQRVLSDPVADILRRYDENDPQISTYRDIADAVQELIDNGSAPLSLQKHINRLKREVEGSREFGVRMDMEGEAGEAMLSALENYVTKRSKKTSNKTQSPAPPVAASPEPKTEAVTETVTASNLPEQPGLKESEIVGMGAAIPEEFKPSQQLPTANKNASIDADRVARGESPLMSAMRKSDPELWDQAMAVVENDWQAADKLIARHKAEPFVPTDTDLMVLLHRRTDLKNTFAKLSREYAEASEAGRTEIAEGAKTSRDAVLEQLREIEAVVGRGDTAMGTMTGRALRARRLAMNEDYSLASLIVDREAALKRRLTPEETVELEKISQEQAVKSEALAKKEAELEARAQEIEARGIAERAAKEQEFSPYVLKLAEDIVKSWDARADRARQRLREKWGRTSTGLDPTILIDLSEIGVSHLAHAGLDFAKWTARMVDDLGEFAERAKPYFEKAFERSKKLAEDEKAKRAGPKKAEVDKAITRTATPENIDGIVSRLAKRFEKNPKLDFSMPARKLARYFYEQGITKPMELVDAVHAKLLEAMPEVTKRQTMDALSGYGRFTPLKKDAVSVGLRDAYGQLQQIAKLEDMAQGQAPLKTGHERRVPTDEERRLIKQVEEAKRRGGYQVTDPATQLRTTLQAAKTAIKNRIADLEFEISKKERILKTKTPMVPDSELVSLREKRDALRKEHSEIFGAKEITEAQRLKRAEAAIDRQIKEVQSQLDSGEVFTPSKPKRPTSPAIESKLQDLAELRLRRYYERQRIQPKGEIEAKELGILSNSKKQVQKQIESLSKAIADRTKIIKNKRNLPTDPELASLREKRDFIREVYDEVFQPAPLTEAQRLAKWKELTRDKIDDYKMRLGERDFAPRKRPDPPRLDKEAIKLRFELHKVHNALMDMRLRDQLKQRTRARKLVDGIANVIRFSRAVITGGEFSAVLRQGGFTAFSRPLLAAKSLKPMFEAMMSEEAQFRINEEIQTRPNAPLYQRNKLQFTESGVRLSTMEEHYMFRVSEKIGRNPLAKYPLKAINAFQRAYVTYLNKLRADSFDALLDIYGDSPEMQKQIANLINVATGRGSASVGKYVGPGANAVFFAPRYSISRFQLLLGQPGWSGNMATRKMVIQEYGRALAGAAVVYSLASMAGGKIEDDPRSPDFGKIKLGNTRIDPLFGLAQVTRLLATEATGERVNRKGQKIPIRGKVPYGQPDAYDVAANFSRTKLSPTVGASVSLATGEDPVGQKFTLKDALIQSAVPITYGDILKAMEEQGVEKGTAIAILAMFGMGVQTYDANAKREE